MWVADCGSGAAGVVDMRRGKKKEGRMRKEGGQDEEGERNEGDTGRWHGKKAKLRLKGRV